MATVKPVGQENDTKQISSKGKPSPKFDKKGGKRGKKDPRREDGFDRAKKFSCNDPEWYVLHPELLRDVASLAFNHAVGAEIVGSQYDYEEFPYLAVINCIPVPGISLHGTSAVNIAVRSVYTFVRHANSGHSNYEMAGLGMYLLATSSVIIGLLLAERALGLSKAYVFKNRTMSESVLQSLFSVGYSDLVKNNADYTARLNILWAKLGSLCIPKDFKFLDRWTWMASHVFKDHESSKAGLYAFDFPNLWDFQATFLTTGGSLQLFEPDRSSGMSQYLDDIEYLLDNILTDEDMNIMSGDILKAYGPENLVKFAFTPYDYILYPEYKEEMLPQIQNMATVPLYSSLNNPIGLGPYCGELISTADRTAVQGTWGCIYQVDNTILCGFGLNVTGMSYDNEYPTFDATTASCQVPQEKDRPGVLISSTKETPEPGDVMVATRLHPVFSTKSSTLSGRGIMYVSSCGTEIPTSVLVSLIGTNANKGYATIHTEAGFLSSNTVGIKSNLLSILKASQLDWFPICYHAENSSGTSFYSPMSYRGVFGDLDNYTPLSSSDLSAMHNAAVLAEFTTPIMNIFNPK